MNVSSMDSILENKNSVWLGINMYSNFPSPVLLIFSCRGSYFQTSRYRHLEVSKREVSACALPYFWIQKDCFSFQKCLKEEIIAIGRHMWSVTALNIATDVWQGKATSDGGLFDYLSSECNFSVSSYLVQISWKEMYKSALRKDLSLNSKLQWNG